MAMKNPPWCPSTLSSSWYLLQLYCLCSYIANLYYITEEKTEINGKEERSAQNFKKFRIVCLLTHNISFTNKHHNHCFVRICRLCNALPIIDLNMSIQSMKNI